jgi:hypothetical protein
MKQANDSPAPVMLLWSCEFTDTMAGAANYSWVRRETVELPSHTTDRAIVRACKAALALTGVRCRTTPRGGCEGWELRPVGSSTVAFIVLGE